MSDQPNPVAATENKLINFFTDNGLPLPLIRHRGRGDLVATLVVYFSIILGLLLLLGGSSMEYLEAGRKVTIKIPELKSLTAALAPLLATLAALWGYLKKRKEDQDAAVPK
jgi:hypothetical protein